MNTFFFGCRSNLLDGFFEIGVSFVFFLCNDLYAVGGCAAVGALLVALVALRAMLV